MLNRDHFFIDYSEIRGRSLSDIGILFKEHNKKIIGDIEIRELAFLNPPNGVYLIYESDIYEGLLYVGKATSRSFVERLPSHFDPRHDGWLNTLPKKVEANEYLEWSKALTKALDLKILVIGINKKNDAVNLESIFRSFLQPRYNKTLQRYKGTEII